MFGSEIVIVQTGIDLTKVLRYKIRIMSILINGPAFVFCVNKLAVTSIYVPILTLLNNNLFICYHAVREEVAVGIHRIAHIAG